MRFGAAREFSSPAEQENFQHLIGDIVWFGLALAATSRFLSVFAIRVGASPLDLGLISSLPPLVLLFSSMLGGWWMRRYDSAAKSLLWPGLIMRLPFLLPAFTPFLPLHLQPLWLIASVTVPAVTQGVSGVIFTVLVRQGIRDENMTAILSQRSVAMNVAIAVAAVAFGAWLEAVPFPLNYQAMFVVAFLLTLVSAWHCQKLQPLEPPPRTPLPATATQPQPIVGGSPWRSARFLTVVLVIMLSHVAFTSITSITPIRLVNDLGANEGFMALSALSELVAGAIISLFADRLVLWLGNRGVIGLSMVFTGAGALVLTVVTSLPLTLIGTALSGAAWTAATIGVFGFFIETAPYDEVTSYSTAYQQAVGLALFIGPMLGSGLVQAGMPVVQVLLIGAVLRFIAGLLTQNAVTLRKGRLTRGRPHTALTSSK